MSTVDAAGMAEQFAYYDVYASEARYNNQLSLVNSKRSAYSSLQSSLNSLKTSLYDFTKYNGSVSKAGATTSNDEYLSVSADDNAVNADLDIFVEQTASAEQQVFNLEGIQDPQTVILPQNGAMEITRNGEAIYTINFNDIAADLGREVTYQDVVNEINKVAGDDLNANLVRTNGQLMLMVSSNETGEENAFSMSMQNLDTGTSETAQQLKAAQDAKIWLGGEGTGLQLTNGSNTFNDLVDGVDVTLIKAQASGTDTTNIQVATNTDSTIEALQGFVDKYNEIMGKINDLTSTSSTEDGSRGILASDSTTRGIKSAMSSLLRGEHNGNYLFELGISFKTDGTLEFDTDEFEEAFENSDFDINGMLIGDSGLFSKLESTIDTYSNSATGMLSSRIDTLDSQKSSIDSSLESLELKYEKSYNIYLRQFTAMNEAITSMQQAMSSFLY